MYSLPELASRLSAYIVTLTDNVKCDIAKHLSELGAQSRRYFPETDDTNDWIRYPFHALPPVHLPISEQEPHQNCNKRFCEN